MINLIEDTFKIKESVLEEFNKTEKVSIKIAHKKGERFYVTKALLEKINRNKEVVDHILNNFNIIDKKKEKSIKESELQK